MYLCEVFCVLSNQSPMKTRWPVFTALCYMHCYLTATMRTGGECSLFQTSLLMIIILYSLFVVYCISILPVQRGVTVLLLML